MNEFYPRTAKERHFFYSSNQSSKIGTTEETRLNQVSEIKNQQVFSMAHLAASQNISLVHIFIHVQTFNIPIVHVD